MQKYIFFKQIEVQEHNERNFELAAPMATQLEASHCTG